jgi:hypothetical protein
MGSMIDHPSFSTMKALCASDSGMGKTGSLACLVDAGFNLRILDYDQGLSVLKGYVKDRAKLANVHYVDGLKEDFGLTAGRLGVKKAHAFQRGMDALDKGGEEYWGKAGAHIGPLATWSPCDILVLDTLSSIGRSALWLVMQLNAAGFKQPEIQHYGTAMENVERMVQMVTSELAPCHVIVNTHVTSVEGDSRLYPEALGSKLPPKIGRYFDNVVAINLTQGQRVFQTKKAGLLPLKSAVPLPETLPIGDGWIKIMETLTGKTIDQIRA